jgi:hypothetical protein
MAYEHGFVIAMWWLSLATGVDEGLVHVKHKYFLFFSDMFFNGLRDDKSG